jgi:ABC-2 type transport system ATP-binding protein
MEKVISVNHLIKKFGKYTALNGIDFECNEGEIFGFLGPNGAGKTTTIRCLMDFLRPTSGTISIFGMDSILDSLAIRKNVGYLSADIGLYPNWTGKEHLEFVTNLRGSKALLPELKEQFTLDFKKPVRQLSTGNKQKLGIILAAVGKPKLLILDEPTRGLDPLFQSEFYKLLTKLNNEGTTVFMSSHNLNEVEKICQRVLILKEGKIVSNGDIETVKSLGMHLVNAYFKDHFTRTEFNNVPNTEIVGNLHEGLMFKVKGDINPLLKALSKHELRDLEVNNSNLEDVFMDFYKK